MSTPTVCRYTGPMTVPPPRLVDETIRLARLVGGQPAHTSLTDAFEHAILSAHDGVSSRLATLSLSVAYRDAEYLTLRLADVDAADRDRQEHGATTGHDICCGGECDCAARSWARTVRCETCEGAPQDGVDQAVGAFLHVIATALGYSAVDALFAAADRS